MKKKTLKIFMNSFIVSLFAIWVANELFLVPAKQQENVNFAKSNISLFFMNDENVVSAALDPVNVASLKAPVSNSFDTNTQIDESVFFWKETITSDDKVRVSSAEDAADIPLEYSDNKSNKPTPYINEYNIKKSVSVSTEKSSPVKKEVTEEKVVRSEPKKETISLELASLGEVAQSNFEPEEESNDSDFIPIEAGMYADKSSNIEIVDNAPTSQIAMAEGSILVETVAVENQKETLEQDPWQPMSDKSLSGDNPWVVARGAKFAKNTQASEDNYGTLNESEIVKALQPELLEQDGEVQVAEMVKNILIPIPDKILNDKNLTPQLVSPKKSEKKDIPNLAEGEIVSSDNIKDDKQKGKGLFKSITSIFSSEQGDESGDAFEQDASSEQSGKKKGLFAAFSKDKSSAAKILPAEMKLSFQPGRAEISGQTLKWIEAFAMKANAENNVFLEIRIDRNSSFELQQKRLNLLYNILTNKGVGYGKINTVFTSREPNSFIIRTLKINENVNNDMPKSNNRQSLNYQSW